MSEEDWHDSGLEYANDILEHYGVKGMKWGVRRSRKQLAAARGDRRKKKASKLRSKAEKLESDASALEARGPRRYAGETKSSVNAQAQNMRLAAKAKRADADAAEEGRLTSRQKTMLKGAGIAAGIVAVGATYSVISSGEASSHIRRGKAFLEGKEFKFDEKMMLSGDMSVEGLMRNVVDPINPGFGKPGTKMNCRRCTIAYELRRRGLDVEATKTLTATGQNGLGMENLFAYNSKPDRFTGSFATVSKWYWRDRKNQAFDLGMGKEMIKNDGLNIEMPDKIFKKLRTMPNGSRGELGVSFGASGHSVAWEIIGGKPYIFDAQRGKRYANADSLIKDFGMHIQEAGITRLDNRELNVAQLNRWVRNK